jgi:hypothetical protein
MSQAKKLLQCLNYQHLRVIIAFSHISARSGFHLLMLAREAALPIH